MNRLMIQWRELAPRERLLIQAGAMVLVVTVLAVLVVKPLLAQRVVARERLALVLEDSLWLQARLGRQDATAMACPLSPGDETPGDLAARHGVTLGAESGSASGDMGLSLSAASGNSVLAFVRDLECRGYQLGSLELDSSNPQGMVSGRATLIASVTKPS